MQTIETAFAGEERLGLFELYEALTPENLKKYLDANPGVEQNLNCQSRSALIQPKALRNRTDLEQSLSNWQLFAKAAIYGVTNHSGQSADEYHDFHSFEHECEYPIQAYAIISVQGDYLQMQVTGEQGPAVWRLPLENAAMNVCRWFRPASMTGDDLHEAIVAAANLPDEKRSKSIPIYSGVGVLTMMLNPRESGGTPARFPMYEHRIKEFPEVSSAVVGRLFHLFEKIDNQYEWANYHEDGEERDVMNALRQSTKKRLCGVCLDAPDSKEGRKPRAFAEQYKTRAYATVTVFHHYIELCVSTKEGLALWKLPFPFIFNMDLYKQGVRGGMDMEWIELFKNFFPDGIDVNCFMKSVHDTRLKNRNEGVEVYRGLGDLTMLKYEAENGVLTPRFPMEKYIQPMFPGKPKKTAADESEGDGFDAALTE